MWGDVKRFCIDNNISQSTYYKYKRENRLSELKNVVKKTRNMERGRILRENGLSWSTYSGRKRLGWSETEALYTPKYQYRLSDGRLLAHALTVNQYHQAWQYINYEDMSVEDAYNRVLHPVKVNRSAKVYKYSVDGVPLKKFCVDNDLNYETARRYANNQITFERRSENVNRVVSALRGKKIYIGRWGRF